jgi:hypothetical protein
MTKIDLLNKIFFKIHFSLLFWATKRRIATIFIKMRERQRENRFKIQAFSELRQRLSLFFTIFWEID